MREGRIAAGIGYGIPSDRNATLANHAGRKLGALINGTGPVSSRIGTETMDIPMSAVRLLKMILDRMAGGHRRIRAEDVLAWRRKTETRRHEALNELTVRDQELGLQ